MQSLLSLGLKYQYCDVPHFQALYLKSFIYSNYGFDGGVSIKCQMLIDSCQFRSLQPF